MNKSIHEFIKEMRIEQRLSIQALAELSGVSASHISRIESHKRNPSYETLSKLAPPLQVEYEKLLEVANLLDKISNHVDLDILLSSKHLMFRGKIVDDSVKEQIREILEQ